MGEKKLTNFLSFVWLVRNNHCMSFSSVIILFKTLISISFMFLIFGCAATFNETHYFQLEQTDSGKAMNYYRMTVSGSAIMFFNQLLILLYGETIVLIMYW